MTLRKIARWLRVAPRWELPFTMGIVSLAVAIPTAGLLFFMNRAMNGERQELLADLQRTRRTALETAAARIREAVEARTRAASAAEDARSPGSRFCSIVEGARTDGCLVLDASGAVLFPVLTVPEPMDRRTGVEGKADELLDDFRHEIVRTGQAPAAPSIQKLADAFSRPRLQKTRDGSGRLLHPAAALAAMHTLATGDPARAAHLATLEKAVADYDHDMPSSQRLFLWHELQALGSQVVLPHAAEEALSLTMAGHGFLPEEKGVFVPSPQDPSVLAIRPAGQSVVLYLRQHKLLDELHAFAGKALAAHGLTARIEPPGAGQDAAALASIALGRPLPGWTLTADGPDASLAIAARIERMKTVYLVSAIGGCLLIGLLTGWAIRRFAQRARDTQVRQDFLSVVSHELKTPLTSIRMFVDSLAGGGLQEEERARTYLEFIRRENERLSRLVENFLTFSRIESGRMAFDFHVVHPDDIADAVRDAVSGRTDQPGCQFQTSSSPDLPLVRADSSFLTTALVNLIDNALKYTREDKQIVFSVTAETGDAIFAVTDNGIGMSAEALKHLGEKFFRDRKAAIDGRRGFGLGLHIVRSIVDAHGGKLEVTSTVGAGSRFAIRLPGTSPDET